jgi:hypothetical protein
MARVVDLLKHQPISAKLWVVSDADVRIRGSVVSYP